jgi:hypothetical protein
VTSPDGQPDAATGSFADESARLLGAFREWAAKGHDAANAFAGERASGSTAAEGHAAECTYCPVCQGLALLRGAKPEVAEHLVEALSSLAAAVAALLPHDSATAERRSPDRAQHIDVSGDDVAGSAR